MADLEYLAMQILLIFITMFFFFSFAQYEEIYVVVVSNQNTASISSKDIKRLYFWPVARFTDGVQAVPINQAVSNAARMAFEEKFLAKDSRKMQQYWASMVFSAKFDMPKEIIPEKELISFLEENPEHLRYIHKSKLNPNLRAPFFY